MLRKIKIIPNLLRNLLFLVELGLAVNLAHSQPLIVLLIKIAV